MAPCSSPYMTPYYNENFRASCDEAKREQETHKPKPTNPLLKNPYHMGLKMPNAEDCMEYPPDDVQPNKPTTRQLNLTASLAIIFNRTEEDLQTNNRYMNPEANKRVLLQRKLKKKVRFLVNDIQGNERPHCRRKTTGENGYGFLHSSTCRNRWYEEDLSPAEFESRANFLSVLVNTRTDGSTKANRKVDPLNPGLTPDNSGSLSSLSATVNSIDIHDNRNPGLRCKHPENREFRKPTRETKPMDCTPQFSDKAIDFELPKKIDEETSSKPDSVRSEGACEIVKSNDSGFYSSAEKDKDISVKSRANSVSSVSSYDSGFHSSATKDKDATLRDLLSSSESEGESETDKTDATAIELSDSEPLPITEKRPDSKPVMWFEKQMTEAAVVKQSFSEGYKNPFKATKDENPSVPITLSPSTLGKLICDNKTVPLPVLSIRDLFPNTFLFNTPSPDDIVRGRQKHVGSKCAILVQ